MGEQRMTWRRAVMSALVQRGFDPDEELGAEDAVAALREGASLTILLHRPRGSGEFKTIHVGEGY